jgi:ABC-type uncharacterized transport system fused permease/ATPase subunit
VTDLISSHAEHCFHLEKAKEVLQQCHLSDLLSLLPSSFKTAAASQPLNNDDLIDRLSSGEKQCLAISRLIFQYMEGNIVSSFLLFSLMI